MPTSTECELKIVTLFLNIGGNNQHVNKLHEYLQDYKLVVEKECREKMIAIVDDGHDSIKKKINNNFWDNEFRK